MDAYADDCKYSDDFAAFGGPGSTPRFKKNVANLGALLWVIIFSRGRGGAVLWGGGGGRGRVEHCYACSRGGGGGLLGVGGGRD